MTENKSSIGGMKQSIGLRVVGSQPKDGNLINYRSCALHESIKMKILKINEYDLKWWIPFINI